MIFRNPLFLLFIILVVPLFIFFAGRQRREAAFKFSSGELLSGFRKSLRLRLSTKLVYVRMLSVILFIVAFARPQAPIEETEITTEGIEIVLAVDVSTSMRAEDFELHGARQNRLEVVKDVVKDFIKSRRGDRIGLVVFAGRPYTVCPLTLDYEWLLHNLDRAQIGMIEDGTAVGSGIAASSNRLKDTEAKSKVIILLTDGRNNAGKISPLTAAEAAKALKIKIYTIGAGSEGPVPYPFTDRFGRSIYRPVKIDIDDETLERIADVTGGKYFRALNTGGLREIYREIDELEKVPIKERGFMEYRELFGLFLMPGFVILLLEILFGNTVLRRLP